MKSTLSAAVTLSVALLVGCSTPEKPNPLIASLDSLMISVVDTAKFNGNVLVAQNGEIIYQKSFGLSNFYTNEQLNDSSVFDLASVSKAFTAMSIVMLKEEGKLNYDDDVKKYIPEWPYDGMTIRHFLHHTSGAPAYEYFNDKQWDPKKVAFNEDIVKLIAKYKPAILFKPGEKWEYSNTGYAMLATITERISGKSFGEFLNERIFTPLQMSHTQVWNTRRSGGEPIPNYAYGFVYSDSLKKYALPDSLNETWYVLTLDGIVGDGALNSTTGDLFKWNNALYTEQLASRTSMDEIFTSGKLNNDSLHNYGFGWFLEDDTIAGKITRHTGSWPGYRNLLKRFTDRKDCIIVLTNNNNPSARTTVGNEISKRLNWYKSRLN